MTSWSQKASHGLLQNIELQNHRVRVYADRLAISRWDGGRMTWEELQAVKQELWGDSVAVEVYPAGSDVVNLRHTRHLWRSPEIDSAVRDTCLHPEFQIREC